MHDGYRLEGRVVEQPDGDRQITSWTLSRGDIDGVDVSGLTVLLVYPGPVVVLDELATPEQAEAVREVFADRSSSFYLAPLTVRSDRLSISIPEQGIDCHVTLSAS
jgi:hypothetical protein